MHNAIKSSFGYISATIKRSSLEDIWGAQISSASDQFVVKYARTKLQKVLFGINEVSTGLDIESLNMSHTTAITMLT